MLKSSTDMVSLLVSLLIERAMTDESLKAQAESWNMIVVVETNYYPITLQFDAGLRISKGTTDQADLVIRTTMDMIVDIIRGNLTLLGAFARKRISMKGMLRHPVSVYRFYRLFNRALRM